MGHPLMKFGIAGVTPKPCMGTDGKLGMKRTLFVMKAKLTLLLLLLMKGFVVVVIVVVVKEILMNES